MSDVSAPKPYEQWRLDPTDRAEDAASVFGHDLIRYCRTEALKSADTLKLPQTSEELRELVAAAVDLALHNVADLLEGFFPVNAGPNHKISYALSVCVADVEGRSKEKIEISPCLLDLPIGYWKWRDSPQ